MTIVSVAGEIIGREDALQELRGGGAVYVAPEITDLPKFLLAYDGLHWQDVLTEAQYELGEDVAYIDTLDDGGWWVQEFKTGCRFETPDEALDCAMTQPLSLYVMTRALREET